MVAFLHLEQAQVEEVRRKRRRELHCITLHCTHCHGDMKSFVSRRLGSYARQCINANVSNVAVVTGGSRGIGKAICLALGENGCKVIVNYHSNQALAESVVEEINDKWAVIGSRAIAVRADCSKQDDIKQLFNAAVSEFGSVDILINNAGITRDKLVVKMKPEDFTDVIQLNLTGTFLCAQAAFAGSMMRTRRGRIINIASIVGQMGNQGQANYAASKGGVIGLTKSLAKEFATRNICVNAVCPGYIDTEMTMQMHTPDNMLAHITTSIPLGRLGTVEEVAGLVRFLALDPAGAYITGHCFNIDGGMAMGAT